MKNQLSFTGKMLSFCMLGVTYLLMKIVTKTMSVVQQNVVGVD
jgi:hypothetical protein